MKFYNIHDNGDGTADITLRPYRKEARKEDEEEEIRIMRGVVLFDGIENDIRERFSAWCESAEKIIL